MNGEDPVTSSPVPDDQALPSHQSESSPDSVTEIALGLKEVRLRMLICVRGDAPVPSPPVAGLPCRGELKEGSRTESEFIAIVTWSTQFPEGKAPITISGKHELVFSIAKPVTEATAAYYSEVNGVILVYPYIRQLVDELSTKSLGRSIMIPPLDVPDFVKKWATRKKAPQAIEQGNAGAHPDGAQATR